jgi:hypothetical protein
MIEVMDKLKGNFMQAVQRVVYRWTHPSNEREATLPPADAETVPRHPLLGALGGLAVVMPGTDLTEPADPTWGGK